MTETSFTPGPWAAFTDDVSEPQHTNIVAFKGQTSVVFSLPGRHKNEADVRLIAASPDLYEALEALADEGLRERLLDAQQDINFHANSTMAQSVADASALIDEIDGLMSCARAALRKARGASSNV